MSISTARAGASSADHGGLPIPLRNDALTAANPYTNRAPSPRTVAATDGRRRASALLCVRRTRGAPHTTRRAVS
eukprot:2044558-Prymnesium_polylepis.1